MNNHNINSKESNALYSVWVPLGFCKVNTMLLSPFYRWGNCDSIITKIIHYCIKLIIIMTANTYWACITFQALCSVLWIYHTSSNLIFNFTLWRSPKLKEINFPKVLHPAGRRKGQDSNPGPSDSIAYTYAIKPCGPTMKFSLPRTHDSIQTDINFLSSPTGLRKVQFLICW